MAVSALCEAELELVVTPSTIPPSPAAIIAAIARCGLNPTVDPRNNSRVKESHSSCLATKTACIQVPG